MYLYIVNFPATLWDAIIHQMNEGSIPDYVLVSEFLLNLVEDKDVGSVPIGRESALTFMEGFICDSW